MSLNFSTVLPSDRERTITTYDFIDIASNRAITAFYPAQVNRGNTSFYTLTNGVFPSTKTNERKAFTNQGTYVIQHNNNYETIMDTAITIEGEIITSIPVVVDGDAGIQGSVFVSGAVFISGATTLTQLGANMTGDVKVNPVSGTNEGISSMRITIPETKIKIGEYLRLHIESWAKVLSVGTAWVWLGQDPRGDGTHGTTDERDIGATNSSVTSRAQMLIPIKINL